MTNEWLVLIAYLLPDGRVASAFWRRWTQVGLIGVAPLVIGAAGDDQGFRDAHHGADPPLPWLPENVSGGLGLVGLVLVVGLLFGSVFAVRGRLRRATGEERLKLLWLICGGLPVPLALVIGWAQHFLLDDNGAVVFYTALGLAAVALPVAIGIAIRTSTLRWTPHCVRPRC